MAEGGNQEVNDNLSPKNQSEKQMGNKMINVAEAHPDLPIGGEFANSFVGNQPNSEHQIHTRDSSTYYKSVLYNGPPLTPSASVDSIPDHSRDLPTTADGTSSRHINGEENTTTEASMQSTYLGKAPGVEDTSAQNVSTGSYTSEGKNTNDLSTGKTSAAAAADGVSDGCAHQNIKNVPVSRFHSDVSAVGVTPAHVPAKGGKSVPMSVAAGCTSGSTKLNGAAASGTADVSVSSGSTCTFDSRNIPPVRSGSFPSSTEGNASSNPSYSVNPTGDTRLARLRMPVLDWIRKKLDSRSKNNWESLADIHGWKYEDIMHHYQDCRHYQRSPFLSLLETETFLTYTVHMFCEDMKSIRRIDILKEFGDVLQQANA